MGAIMSEFKKTVCPRCGVKSGETCRTGSGNRYPSLHMERRRAYSVMLAKRRNAMRTKSEGVSASTSPVDSQKDLRNRVSIMLWAINKCGSTELAQDAFDRAIRAVEDDS